MPSEAHAEIIADLCARYREPGRHYHTLEHVAELLAWLEHLRDHAERPALIAWAIWYHDAIYDPQRTDNEARSAELASAMLPKLGLSSGECDHVCALVRATAAHHAEAACGDTALFLDLDLSILGASAARYAAYTQQVQAEYAFVPEQTFRIKRAALLSTWLARPRIYFTDVCHALFDARARSNLAREVAQLTTKSP